MRWLGCLLVLSLSSATATKVVVFTVATEQTEGLTRLQRSALFHEIQMQVLGLGQEWRGGDTRTQPGGGQKIRLLREALKEYKDEKDTLIVFTDAYDVVWAQGVDVLVERLQEHFHDFRVVFGAEPYCWPAPELAIEYPLIEFGKRYLNSGLFAGFAPEVYRLLNVKEVADEDDDQLYYTHIYLDETLRRELKMGLDSISRIFQNLNGVIEDVELSFDDEGRALPFNAAYNTHPVLVHGNGASKLFLNYLGSYLAGEWNSLSGCRRCNQRKSLKEESEMDGESAELPTISVAFFIHKAIPFVSESLATLSLQDYPKAKIHLFLYNSQHFHLDTVAAWLKEQKGEFLSRQVVNVDGVTGERDARQDTLKAAMARGSEHVLFLDADCLLQDPSALRTLVEKAAFYEVAALTPLLHQPAKLFSNFWGALDSNGYYARSEDYIAIVNGNRVGLWNVPFVSSPVLLSGRQLLEKLASSRPFHYNKQLDPDMSFSKFARDNGIFLHVSNEDEAGFLIVSDEFDEHLQQNRLHPEMWNLFHNRYLWESRYLHPDYVRTLNAEVSEIPQPCPDVYEYPLMSPRFCREMIEEMEHFGQWSDGTNQDRRLAGGYENVPTRDIHMKQIEFEREWLYFVDEFVRPMQEKIFIGYYHKPVESQMMFVVRYKPEEQASLRPHHDASTYSIDIALNEKGKDYEGGGVRFPRYNCTIAADLIGHTMMFPGRLTHLHEGLPTTAGTRYILVSFLNP